MRLIVLTLVLFLAAVTAPAFAQVTVVYPSTVNSVPLPTDNGCVDDADTGTGLGGGIINAITIPGSDAGPILDVNVQVQMTHTWRGDIQMALTDGTTTVLLANNTGTSGDNFYATFDSAIATGCRDASFCGSTGNCTTPPGPVCGPVQTLDAFNSAEAANRVFTLQICDRASGDVGSLQNWALEVTRNSDPIPRATFTVSKVFTDGNPGEVDVSLSCNTGLILDQTKTISPAQGVVFVVTDYDDGELNCEITEEPNTGYNASYFDGSSSNSVSCEFEEIPWSGSYVCTITNTPAPVDIVVTKEWVFEGTSGATGIDLGYELSLYCDDNYIDTYYADGTGGEFPFSVVPAYPSTSCVVYENVYDDAVEVENGCDDLTISAGNGAACTVTNTVFFEGIPTLNQYGMMLLALLMLGVGVLGFRRFA